uniref:Uncharacterized protein n=1 Tax=Meloidogyne enterolobii TaxID=390850 RepID=A0A6V7XV45_MELEN|nr:unnamed protein product [Meloidogyne enterolobii]
MNLSIIFILFVLFIVILPSYNARISKKTKEMVDYCERHSTNVIHQENRRECCDELIDKIIKKKKNDRFFNKHKHITNEQHIQHVFGYFKKKNDLPKVCREVSSWKTKIGKKLKLHRFGRNKHGQDKNKHKNNQQEHNHHIKHHIKKLKHVNNPLKKLKGKHNGNEKKHKNPVNKLKKMIKKRKPKIKKEQGKKHHLKNILHKDKHN